MLKAFIVMWLYLLVSATILFVAAGRTDWPMRWASLVVYALLSSAGFFLADPEVITERTRMGPGAKKWDVALASISFLFLYPITLLVAGLDAGRFRVIAGYAEYTRRVRYRLVPGIWLFLIGILVWDAGIATAEGGLQVPILVYHRFGPVVADSMTVTTAVFDSELRYLRDHGYSVIPLKQYVDYRLGKASPPPQHSVVITVDDGHRSVYSEMLPIVTRYRVPVTLFIYPSAISNATYAMTWEQLRELQATGLFGIQSHTYWHPNFKTERERLTPSEFERFVSNQLTKSRDKLQAEMGTGIDLLAWPFGIYDDQLTGLAKNVGYVAALTLDGRPARDGDDLMTLPRYLMTNAYRGHAFEQLLSRSAARQ